MARSLRFAVLFSLLCAWSVAAAGSGWSDEELYRFFVGSYELIGRRPDSSLTYTGRIEIRQAGQGLAITRKINGKTVSAKGTIDHTMAEGPATLRIVFTQDDIVYEGSMLHLVDHDNYPWLSGYIYRRDNKTKKVGLEAWFYDHGQMVAK